ncbi:hypothetical protein [Thiothrix subterranea]|uniref:Uncharacterized protein n=1 Tax=Thiothrix subterranea TaxID=2735563 RepID=A0AA51MRU3_9GAMM|nr:hypothetical protein [Thiothrix subterranea]MDQ5769568.1 hypothetical protein [Thiothrix subterranea]WML87151.1 hypothetical protein RCG00_02060 [Thiothrix subterranea]
MKLNSNTTPNGTNKTYPPAHHRDVEHLREELEAIDNLLNVCLDSMRLVDAIELLSTVAVLQMAADRAFEAVTPAKALETTLYEQWLVKCDAQRQQQQAEAHAAWQANLPTGAAEAFQAVNAAYGNPSAEASEPCPTCDGKTGEVQS